MVTILIIISSFVEIIVNKCDNKVDAESPNNYNNNNNHTTKMSDLTRRNKGMTETEDKKPKKRGNIKQPMTISLSLQNVSGVILKVILAFSAISNGSKILSFDKPSSNSIGCLHGLRFFSILWIIMVHTYLNVFAISENKTLRTVVERSYLYQTVSNASFSVDTFFFIR